MLVEMAIADAYAIAWEFTKDQTAPNDLSGYYQHPSYAALKPGQYTDDTQRAIGNCLALIEAKSRHELFNPRTYADAYIKAFKQDPRDGYSRGYQKFIETAHSPDDFIMDIRRGKASNGALMGVAPLGLLPDIQMVKLASLIQAITTHHQDAAIHAQIVALSVHYLDNGGTKGNLRNWLMNNVDWQDGTDQAYRWSYLVDSHDRGLGTSIKASSISSYMVSALTKFDTLSEIILDAVERGGDTDSAAATTVAVASCCTDIELDLPTHLYDQLDLANPGFGLEYLGDLEQKVRHTFG